MAISDLDQDERLIVAALLDAASAAGLLVSIFDGEEWALRPTADQTAIRREIGATDEEVLRFRDPARIGDDGMAEILGAVRLIYGNGPDVIADYSDNAAMRKLVAGADAVAASVEIGLAGRR